MLLTHLLLFLALTISPTDSISSALESFRNVSTYRVTLRSTSDGSSQVIRYFFKRPGFVRMEFVRPHNGAVLVYNPFTKKARVRPFGFFKPFVLTLGPDNGLITSPQGHRVDESDLGSFLKTVNKLASHGQTRMEGFEKAGQRDTLLVDVQGDGEATVSGGVHRYIIWLDPQTYLPVRTKSFNIDGGLLEEVMMDDLDIDVELPDSLFEL